MNSLQEQVTDNLTAYVVSGFSAHSLIPVIGIVSGIMSGVLQLPIAKLLDLWGRAEGFAFMTLVATIGLILMAICRNVETYAAAQVSVPGYVEKRNANTNQVFYHVGFNGMGYVLDVVIADTSSMKNRALAFAFSSSPYIATTFAGPAAAQRFHQTIGFRWAFGFFAVLTPIVSIPIFSILFINQTKAKKLGVLAKEHIRRTMVQNISHYSMEFDGMFYNNPNVNPTNL